MGETRHKIRASECGQARKSDSFSAKWSGVNCWSCLQHQPIRPRQVKAPGPHICVDDGRCSTPSACRYCNRCEVHCLPKQPNNAAAHHKYWDEQPRPTAHRRKK